MHERERERETRTVHSNSLRRLLCVIKSKWKCVMCKMSNSTQNNNNNRRIDMTSTTRLLFGTYVMRCVTCGCVQPTGNGDLYCWHLRCWILDYQPTLQPPLLPSPIRRLLCMRREQTRFRFLTCHNIWLCVRRSHIAPHYPLLMNWMK